MTSIPLYKPYVRDEEMKAVARVLNSQKLSRSSETDAFEKEFAAYIGKKYAITVNSGTSALHTLVRALGWKAGDEVITSPFSYIATANALLYEGVTPVFADIDTQTLNIDPKQIEAKITSKTKGILVAHIFGLPANMDALKKIAAAHELLIIEDACEAIGRPEADFPIAQIGTAAVYSFHENKQLTSGGEGGMIVTDDRILGEKCRSMRDQGRSIDKEWIKKVILGFNFRMTEMQAAYGRVQLAILDKMLVQREILAVRYSMVLKDVPGVSLPFDENKKRSWFLYFILLEDVKTREKVRAALADKGIASSVTYFPPIYDFPMYASSPKDCPHTEDISRRLLALPMFYELKEEEVDRIAAIIKEALLS